MKHINVQVAKRLKGEVKQSYKEEKSKVINLLSTEYNHAFITNFHLIKHINI